MRASYIPAGAIVAPFGSSAVLTRLREAGVTTDQVVAPGPALEARARNGATTVVAADHRNPAAVEATIAVARTHNRPVVAVCGPGVGEFDVDPRIAIVFCDTDRIVGVVRDGAHNEALRGHFDVIGDIHNCHRTLDVLLEELGYDDQFVHHEGRIPVLVGDIVDKGGLDEADVLITLGKVMSAHLDGRLLVVRGNHENNLIRKLINGNDAQNHQVNRTLSAIRSCGEKFVADVVRWFSELPTWLSLDGGDLVVAHAAWDQELASADAEDRKAQRRFENLCLYGKKPEKGLPQRDSYGLPIRLDWAPDYTGDPVVVHGHVIVDAPYVVGNVVNIDTGAYAGGGLTSYSWPERTITTVATVDADRAAKYQVATSAR